MYPRRFFTIAISLALALGTITGVAAQDTDYRPIEDHNYAAYAHAKLDAIDRHEHSTRRLGQEASA